MSYVKLKDLDDFRQNCAKIENRIRELGNPVVIDGVIDPQRYIESDLKVMWLLKETNSDGNWSIVDNYRNHKWLTSCNGLMSIRRIIYTSYGLIHPEIKEWKDYPFSYEEKCQDALRNIAFINISKTPGGSKSDYTFIQNANKKNRELLKLQFETYNPDVVIFGNTLKYVCKDDFDGDFSEENKICTEIGTDFYPTENRLFINAYHPSYCKGITDKDYVMDIVNITRKWNEER